MIGGVAAVAFMGALFAWAAVSGRRKRVGWSAEQEESTDREERPVDMTRIGTLAMDLQDDLREHLPQGAEIVAIGIAAEVRYPCEHGDHTHTSVVPMCTSGSRVHAQALFEEASENIDASWMEHAEADD